MSGCSRCGKNYDARYNVGRWECQLHTGDVRGGTWTCCQQNIDATVGRTGGLGCHRADHDAHPTLGVFAYVRDYMGIAPVQEALTGVVITRKSAFAQLLVAKYGLKQAEADATATQIQRAAILAPGYYEREASDAEASGAVVDIVTANAQQPALPSSDPFAMAIAAIRSFQRGVAKDVDNKRDAARLLTLLANSQDTRRREALHTDLIAAMLLVDADRFPTTREVRRVAADVDLSIRLGLPMAGFFAYPALALRASDHSPLLIQ